LNPRPLGS